MSNAVIFPGQGSQHKGMGAALFDEFPDFVREADTLLGYSVVDYCLNDPKGLLNNTQYTQPLLYVVSALSYLKHCKTHPNPDFVAGHSLGEYAALFASGAIDFSTGLKLVTKRGELMSRIEGGAMLAVLKAEPTEVLTQLAGAGLSDVEVANYNSPSQFVLSGPAKSINAAASQLKALDVMAIPLKVSGAFHSRSMREAADRFNEAVMAATIGEPKIPVLSNITARPHQLDSIGKQLVAQVYNSVQWVDSVRYLMGRGVTEFVELGPGQTLTRLVAEITSHCQPLRDHEVDSANTASGQLASAITDYDVKSERFGSQTFCERFATREPYLIGSMSSGISSVELVSAAAEAKILAFFGSYRLSLQAVETALVELQRNLSGNRCWGVNFVAEPDNPALEMSTAQLLAKHRVPHIEAAGFTTPTPALVYLKAASLCP